VNEEALAHWGAVEPKTNLKLIREYSALQKVLNKFTYVVLQEHVAMFATREQSIFESPIVSHPEHIR
jgi:hypothetical protein